MSMRLNAARLGLATMSGAALAIAAPALANGQHGAPHAGAMSHAQMVSSDFGFGPSTQGVPHHQVYNANGMELTSGGVETVVHTAYQAPAANQAVTHQGAGYASTHTAHHAGYAPQGHYPAPAHAGGGFAREQWLAECRARTYGLRDRKKKGGIIGGLLGAIGGALIGNRVIEGERLGGTLIGAGVGGLAGLAIGALLDRASRGRDESYDCEAALDSYFNQYGGHYGYGQQVPDGYGYSQGYAYQGAAYPGAHYGASYGYSQGYHAGCGGCRPHGAYVPIHYQQRQRVVVRETVTEEIIPGKKRYIPDQVVETHTTIVPAPTYTPQPHKLQPAKMIKR